MRGQKRFDSGCSGRLFDTAGEFVPGVGALKRESLLTLVWSFQELQCPEKKLDYLKKVGMFYEV